MIECYLIDIKNITSKLPTSNFQASEIERLADSILATDGLIRPLILETAGVEQYTVIEGHLEYYAATRAKEKNLLKAEHVNAFIIPAKLQRSAIEQIALLAENRSSHPLPQGVNLSQLLPLLTSTISEQLQPILEQLAAQKQILDTLIKSDRTLITEVVVIPPKPPEPEEKVKPAKVIKPTGTKKESTPAQSKKKPDFGELIAPDRLTIPDSKNEQELKPLASSRKETNILNLMNTLSQEQLIRSMKQSAIPKAEKLAIGIIAKRNIQPEQKFATWETLMAIKGIGLGAATIKKIIDNLK